MTTHGAKYTQAQAQAVQTETNLTLSLHFWRIGACSGCHLKANLYRRAGNARKPRCIRCWKAERLSNATLDLPGL